MPAFFYWMEDEDSMQYRYVIHSFEENNMPNLR
jgi:hypothetical protein